MSRRLSCDRFYGGVENRITNLRSFLAYLWRVSPTGNEAAAWIENEFGGGSDKTRRQYLSFLRGLDLVERVGSHLYPGPAGVRYLKNPKGKTLFAILDAGVAGFDLILDALATRGALTDEELRHVLNSGPYGHDMDGTGVAVQHREWLQALGFARREQDSDGGWHTRPTDAGYELWDAYDDGSLETALPLEQARSQIEHPLQPIPADPVPDNAVAEQETETIQYSAATSSQRAATAEHQQALDRLRRRFAEAGYEIRKTRHSDLIAFTNDGDQIFLFEVKSITAENARSQVRTAVGQVFEYEFMDIEQRDSFSGPAQVGVFLSQAPPQEVQQYLSHLAATERLLVLWWADGIAGPSSESFRSTLGGTD